jgi:hypothetical protein
MDMKGTIFISTHFDVNKKQVVFCSKITGPEFYRISRRIFSNPFFLPKLLGKGTRPGLYICHHKIIVKHGGK